MAKMTNENVKATAIYFTYDHLNKSPPFFAWIATFGHAAKILYPDRAIEKMRKFIADVNDMYKDEGEK